MRVGLPVVVLLVGFVVLSIHVLYLANTYLLLTKSFLVGSSHAIEKIMDTMNEKILITCEGSYCHLKSEWGGVSRIEVVQFLRSGEVVSEEDLGVRLSPFKEYVLRVPRGVDGVRVITGEGNVFFAPVIRDVSELVDVGAFVHIRDFDPWFTVTLDFGHANITSVTYGFCGSFRRYGEVVGWGDWLVGGTATPYRTYTLLERRYGFPVLTGRNLTGVSIMFGEVPAVEVSDVTGLIRGGVLVRASVVGNGTYCLFPRKIIGNANVTVSALNVVPVGGERIVATFGLNGMQLAWVGGEVNGFKVGDYFDLPFHVVAGVPVVNGEVRGASLRSSGRSFVGFVNVSSLRLVESDYWDIVGGEGRFSVSGVGVYVLVFEVEVRCGGLSIRKYLVEHIGSGNYTYNGLEARLVGHDLRVVWREWRVGKCVYVITHLTVAVLDYSHVYVFPLKWCDADGFCVYGGLTAWLGVRGGG